MPLPAPSTTDDCYHCRRRRYHFDSACFLGLYREGLREAVRRMKRPEYEQLTSVASRLLAERVRDWLDHESVDAIVPVPMHWMRLLRRGINGAELIAEIVGGELHVPVRSRMVRCRRRTKKQGTLTPTARFKNVRDAFGLAPGYDLSRARVLLVDDVMTTGATASEVARVLRLGGAASVRVAVIGRGTGAS
jgi:ComF family protein